MNDIDNRQEMRYNDHEPHDTQEDKEEQEPAKAREAQEMAFYGYMRVSTETQAEKGFGLQTQQEEIAKYAAAHGITVDGYYTDAGISGAASDDADEDEAIGKREALLDMLNVLQAGDTVIVLNTSRLWRADMTKAIIKRELLKRKAGVISVQQPKFSIENKDPNDYLINAIMEALDVYERMSIAAKLAHGRTTKAKGGDKPAGVAPFGYQYSTDKKSIVLNDAEAQTVKAMFGAGQTGKTLQQIADMLNGKGISTRSGKEWSRGSIQAILRNQFYTGVLMHQGKPIKGNHEALISKVQFGKVAAQLDRRHK